MKCTGDSIWYTVDGSESARSASRCGYNPHSLVSCQVRANNSAGWSDEATHGSIRTLCDSKLVNTNINECNIHVGIHPGIQCSSQRYISKTAVVIVEM